MGPVIGEQLLPSGWSNGRIIYLAVLSVFRGLVKRISGLYGADRLMSPYSLFEIPERHH